MKRNAASARSRNIVLNKGEDKNLLEPIKRDAAFNALAIDTVKPTQN